MKRHENGSFVEGEDKVAWLDLRCLRIPPNPTSMESQDVSVCENLSGHSTTIKQFLPIGPFMAIFGRLKGEKRGFSVITFLRKIITYSPERFSDSSPLALSFHVVRYEFRGIKRCNQGEVCLKLLCIPSSLSFFRQ